MAYTSRDVPGDQHDNLSKSPISSWVTNTQSYQVTRRREYGDHATSTRVTALRPARFFTDAPVDHRAEEALSRKISETEVEIEEIKEQITNMRAEEKQLLQHRRGIEAEQKAIQEDKNQKQRELAQFQGLQPKLDAAERKLKDAQDQINKHRDNQREIVDRGEKLALKKGQQSLDYANSVEALRSMYVMLFEAEIMKIEARSDLDQLKLRHEAERAQLDEARAAVEEHARVTADLLREGQRLQQACMDTHAEDASERELEVLEEVKVMEPDELDTNIQSTEARLEMTTGGNAGIIAEYEDRAKKIERDRARLTDLVDTLQMLQSQIEEIKGQWEPRLDALVGQISEAFAENFAKIQCAGEVGVHKDEDFEQWAIQIRVKFR